MRLVDADEIKKRERDVVLANGAKHRCFDTTMLFEIPTVDAEPVVRCKDCKWYEESKNSEIYPMRFCYRLKNDNGVRVGYNCDGNDFCSHGERIVDESDRPKDDDFCSWGERKEDETEPGIYKTDMEEQL